MAARLSLLVLFVISHLGCNNTPALTPRQDLEFLLPQKILSLGETSDGTLIANFTSSMRYFTVTPDEGGVIRLANQQLERAIRLRDDLYVTVVTTKEMARIVRMARTPDPRQDN